MMYRFSAFARMHRDWPLLLAWMAAGSIVTLGQPRQAPEHQPPSDARISTLIDGMQDAARSIKAIRANFQQIRTLPNMPRARKTSGVFYLSRERRAIVLHTTAPEPSYIWIDSARMLTYVPADEEATLEEFTDQASRSMIDSVLKLLDPTSGDWRKRYAITLLAEEDGRTTLELVPMDEEARSMIPWIHVVLDTRTWFIMELTYGQEDGEVVRQIFSGHEKNPRLAEGLFVPNLPENTWINTP